MSSPGRIRVLHLITKLSIGGAQEYALLTAERLDRSRFEVHLAGMPGGEWEDRARSVADQVHLIPSMRRGIYGVQNSRAFLQIAALLREQRYHVVHTHSTNAGILGRLAGRLAGVPALVHTVHGFPFNDLTFSPLTRRLLVWLERLSAGCCDRLIMLSELNRLEALRWRLAPAGKMVVTPPGLDLSRFQSPADVAGKRRELGLEDGWPVVGMVGRLAEANAPQVFVEAAREVVRGRPDVHFLVVGDGPLRDRIKGLAADLPQVRFLGYRADIPEIMQALDVFVFPALWGGLSRALTEAMLAGCAVVATNINGVPDLVREGETGLLVTPRDPAAIASRVSCLLDDADLAARLGQNARARIGREFDIDLMVRRIMALYAEILRQKGVPA